MAQKKTTAAQNTSSKKRGRPSKKKQQEEIARTYSILMFGAGLFLLALTFINGSEVWEKYFRAPFFGLFGLSGYLVAALLLYLAVRVAMGMPFKTKAWQSVAFLTLFSSVTVIFSKLGIVGETAQEKFLFLWQQGTMRQAGGVLAAVFAWPLLALGKGVAIAISVMLLVIIAMLLTSVTPYDIYSFVRKTVGGVGSAARDSLGAYTNRSYDDEDYAEQETDYSSEPEFDNEAYANAKKRRGKVDIDLGPTPQDNLPQSNEQPLQPQPIIPDVTGVNTVPDFMQTAQQPQGSLFDTPQSGHTASLFDTVAEPEEDSAEVDDLIRKALGVEDLPKSQTSVPAAQGVTESMAAASGVSTEEPAAAAAEKPQPVPYRLPSTELLDKDTNSRDGGADKELRHNAEKLVSTLESFGVKTKILDISRGPSVTRYELQPELGVKISRITNLADDIALNLASAGVRIEAPIPGKPAVGIEVPNKVKSNVTIRGMLESTAFKKSESPVTFCLGKDIAGKVQVADLAKMPHLLIAGSTGSGKSVCINSIIISFLYKSLPEDLKMILIDPKVVELAEYNGIPHLLMPVVTEPRKAAGALGSAVAEMEKRYQQFAQANVRDIKSYNKVALAEGMDKMPYIAIVIDELADLMMVCGKEVEDYICRIAQKARAAGMHLVVATQRPSVDVITGLIKANIPSRIAFAVSSQIDSRTILDGAGAEKLLGMGDMLYMPVGAQKPIRIQGNYVKDDEIARVIKDIKVDAVAEYNEEMIANTERMAAAEKGGVSTGSSAGGDDGQDPVFKQAVECVVDAGQASTSLLQRRLKLGYARAARIMDEMEQLHIIGPYEGSKPRQVLITRQQFIEMTMNQQQQDTAPSEAPVLQ
ncbi:MAG: DNA translocase FtsK [Oscillospiraceae bacterium]|nr:DNA translocase FtsK [Oscillospiraceae bacterium]